MIRDVLVRGLRLKGFEVSGVATTADAVVAWLHRPKSPDVILAACLAPDPAPLKRTIDQLRAAAIRIPIVVIVNDDDLFPHARELGACECIVHTCFEFDTLADCLQRNFVPGLPREPAERLH